MRLASDAVELVVVPAVGGRVVSLRDVRRRREWLLQGSPPDAEQLAAWSAEEAVFSGPESFGWDECLPTVSVCEDPFDASALPLRDHGDQWGREADLVTDPGRGTVETTWSESRSRYRFRRLSLGDERTVLAEYALTSLAQAPLAHPLVAACRPRTRARLVPRPARVSRARCSGSIGIDLPASAAWPDAGLADGREMSLACVRTGAGWAAKLYAEPPDEIRAVAPNGDRLDLDWDRGFATSLGGWPADGPSVEQVALEPTMSGHDALEGAMADGVERTLGPGERVEWWVRLRLSG